MHIGDLIMGTLVQRGKKYTAVFRKMVEGKTKVKSISLGTEKKSIASKLFAKLNVDYQEGKIDLFNNFSFEEWLRGAESNPQGSPMLKDCIDMYLSDSQHLRDSSKKHYTNILNEMATHISMTFPLKMICREDVAIFLESGNRNNVSYNSYRRHINIFFNWCVNAKLIDDNPVSKLKKKPVDDNLSQQIISESELQMLLTAHEKYVEEGIINKTMTKERQQQLWFRPLIMTYFYAGLRRSEALKLKWSDIDFDQRFMSVRAAKGGKAVIVVILKPLLEELKRWREVSRGELVFPSVKTGLKSDIPLTAGTVQKIFKKILRRTNLDESIHIHSLRHSCVTYLLLNKVDITLVNKTLRHSSLDITKRYEHLVPVNLRDRIDELGL
jgi:integrase